MNSCVETVRREELMKERIMLEKEESLWIKQECRWKQECVGGRRNLEGESRNSDDKEEIKRNKHLEITMVPKYTVENRN